MTVMQCNSQDISTVYHDKTILITGSVGTVGSEGLREIALFDPKEIRLFDNNESKLFFQMQEFGNGIYVVPVLGDVRDFGKLQSVMDGVDVVFHLAAYKHVFLCECNPFDSVRTNVIGTQNVLKAAISAKVGRVLYTSSDKAVNPTNVMGTSKLLAEKVVTASSLQCTNGHRHLIFSSSRFGNVLGSNGSVIPIFQNQIKRGGPVTVTEKEMTRFVMTEKEAAKLVIKGAAIACGGEVFVTKMPVISIVDLAKVMIEILAPVYGFDEDNIGIEFIGARAGEKLYEELMSEEERSRAVEMKDMFSILPALKNGNGKMSYSYPSIMSQHIEKAYISRNEELLTINELKDYLLSNNILGEEVTVFYTSKETPKLKAAV